MSGEMQATQKQIQAFLAYHQALALGRYPDEPLRRLAHLNSAINTVCNYPRVVVTEAEHLNLPHPGDEIAAGEVV